MRNNDRELDLWEMSEKAKITVSADVERKAMIAEIEVNSAVQKAERLADIRAKEELKKTVISCTANGSVILQREGFGEKISGTLPIKIKGAQCYCHIGDVQPAALVLVVEKEAGEEVFLFWDLGLVEDRHIRKIFERQGIHFGFGEKKEKEIRRQILQMARNMAKTCELPEEHGWYRIDDTWLYAFPEDITWREVRALC